MLSSKTYSMNTTKEVVMNHNNKSYRNLYRFEVRQNYRSFIIWILVIIGVMVLFMSTYPSFQSADYMQLVNAKIDALPKGFGVAFGLGGITGINFKDLYFFYSYMSQFYVIAIVIYAISLGSNIISKENSEKHIDYLATKPIRKGTIIIAKYTVLVTFILAITAGLLLAGCLTILFLNTNNSPFFYQIIRLSVKSFLVYLFFGTLAFSISAASKKTSRSSLFVVGLFFISYLTGIISQIQPKFESLKYLSPFFMFETTKAGQGFSQQDYLYMLALTLASTVLIVIAYWRYTTKDLSL